MFTKGHLDMETFVSAQENDERAKTDDEDAAEEGEGGQSGDADLDDELSPEGNKEDTGEGDLELEDEETEAFPEVE